MLVLPLLDPTRAVGLRENRLITDRAVRRAFKIPGPVTSYKRTTVTVPTHDGAQLVTDVYRPRDDSAAKATVLIRSPYGRRFPLDLLHARVFAGSGYQVVVQSVRGRSGSSGAFEPVVNEAADGQDAVAWLRQQEWFTGRIATFGGSYLGFVQWALLADAPDELHASVIAVGPHDFARGVHPGGAFALGDMLGWSVAMASPEGGPLTQMRHAASARRQAAVQRDRLPLTAAAAALQDDGAPWYLEWLEHENLSDPFWDRYRAGDALKNSNVPTLLISGWRDALLDQTLEQYDALRSRDVDVAMTVGPWTHMDTATRAAGHVTREALEWFDRVFVDRTAARPPIRAFVTGAEEWRSVESWPTPTTDRHWQLAAGALTDDDGDTGTTSFVFDPAQPTPAVGGRTLDPGSAGRKNNSALARRADVVTFTSAALASPVEICGTPTLRLRVSVANPHADLFVRLCEVDSKGRSWNIADGFMRLDPSVAADEVQELDVELDPCWHRIAAGHQLQLLVAGGAHPRFARNLGTNEPAASGTTMLAQPHTIHHEGSGISLPVVMAG